MVFPKCGSVSLQHFLGSNTIRYEYAYLDNGKEMFLDTYPDRQPVFIVRNPVERTWSAYRFFKMHEKMSLEEFLKPKPIYDQRLGIDDPIRQSDYMKYMEKWMDLNPRIVKLESMKLPRKNTTEIFRKMNDGERKLLEQVLEDSIKKYHEIKEISF